MSQSAEYLLGSSLSERDRLLRQGEIHGAEARSLLDRIGVQPGWRAIDVGCGPLGIHRDKIAAAGLLRAEEVDELAEELRVHLAHPDALVVYSLLFPAWGRKPALGR